MELSLAAYGLNWPAASGTVARFLALIRSWPECLDRRKMPGHLTASAWVVDPTGREVLLTHHRKLDRWVQLGGHADGNQNLPGVARTEAEEEAGAVDLELLSVLDSISPRASAEEWSIFDLDIHPIPPYGVVPAHLHFDVRFAFRSPCRIDPRVSDESYDVQWVPVDALSRFTRERSMLRMAEKWRRYSDRSTR